MTARAALLVLILIAARSACSATYIEKKDVPDAPFSEWASPVKEMPLGGGFAASIGGSLQTRAQKSDNRRDFSDRLNDEDFSVFSRERLNLDVHHGKTFRAFFEVQDAHEFWRDHLPGPNPNENSLDIYQAFGELGLMYDIVDKPSLIFKVGRQTLVFGHEHLFGDNDWLNRGTQNFDVARTTWRPDGFQIDVFAGWPVTADDRNLDAPRSHMNLAVGNIKALGIPKGHNVEGMLVYKWNEKTNFPGEGGNVGPEREVIINGLADGIFCSNWDYKLEGTIETGERGEDNIRAWRAIGEIAYTHRFLNWRSIRFALNYSQTSGDKDPTDRTTESFDPLFTRQFGYHGKILLTGARNLEDLHSKVQLKAWRGGLIEIDHHLLKQQQAKGGFFAANGNLLRRNLAGQAGKEIGQEIDFQVSHSFHDNLSVTGGAFIFDPGRLFEKSGTRNSDNATQVFVQVNVGF